MNLKYYVGIDLGGTFIKGGIVDSYGKIIITKTVLTQSDLGNNKVILNIVNLANFLMSDARKKGISSFSGVGIGVPGIIDSAKGICICSHNLNFKNFNIAKEIQQKLNLDVKIINDANASTLAEYYYGAGKECSDIVMLTLGTGVGGGAIINNQLLLGNCSAGAEFGHIVVCVNGKKCSCGRNGCLEQYASATAITNLTKHAMQNNKQSKMWEVGSLDNVTAKTPFDYKDIDTIANDIVKDFIFYLSVALTNIANVLRPEIIILGGGVANQKQNITKPLQEIINSQIFASNQTPKVKVVTAKLGSNAGILGAVCNFFQK